MRLTGHASSILSVIQSSQSPFNLDDGLQIALQFAHGDFAIGASRGQPGIVIGIGVHGQLISCTVYALLVKLQLCKQTFAKHFEVTLAFAFVLMRFGFHGSHFPFAGMGYTVRRPAMK